MRKLHFSPQIKKKDRIFSLAWNIVYWLLKSPCFEFFGMENTVFFEPKSWWKYNIYWLLKSSSFELFGNGKYGFFLRQKVSGKIIFTGYWNALVLNFSGMENIVFLRQKVDGKMIFTGNWKVLVLNFSVIENPVIFEAKSKWKDDIYWLVKSYYFWATEKFLFLVIRWWEIRPFFIQKFDVKVIFTCFFSFPWYSRTMEIRFFVQCYFWLP